MFDGSKATVAWADVADELNRLYRDRNLDIRHHDRFTKKLEAWWPHIDDMLRSAAGDLPTSVSHIGTLEHCRRILDAYIDNFRMSNAADLSVKLKRNSGAASCDEGFSLQAIKAGKLG